MYMKDQNKEPTKFKNNFRKGVSNTLSLKYFVHKNHVIESPKISRLSDIYGGFRKDSTSIKSDFREAFLKIFFRD
jgi:hypothetical protein